jgi:FkbM family methyltransferase
MIHPLELVRRAMPQRLKRAIKRRLGRPETKLHDDWRILAPIGPVQEPHVIIDAGSHDGWFFHCWKDWCPTAVVHAFEPSIEAHANSRALYGSDPDIHIVNAGLGSAKGELSLQVMDGIPLGNSFLSHVAATWNEIEYDPGAISTRTVPVTTLDDYAAEHGLGEIHLLKIRVQGFELEVLRGAAALLSRTRYVFVGSGIRPLYAGAPKFSTVYDHLDAAGFHLIGMQAWHRGNLTLVEADMLFRRNDLMPPIDPEIGRIYPTVGR